MLTIKQYFKNMVAFLEKSSIAIQPYSIGLFNNIDNKVYEVTSGSGTLVSINGVYGILTCHHVSDDVIIKDNLSYTFVPLNGTLEHIIIDSIISLPCKSNDEPDIDISFIILPNLEVNKLINHGKQFLNLDAQLSLSTKMITINNNQDIVWMAQGFVGEDSEFICENERRILHYPHAAPYALCPELQKMDLAVVQYAGMKPFRSDNIVCPIQTCELKPDNFHGMSGSALWKIYFNASQEVCDIILVGIVTEQSSSDKIICRGPIALYESFYPFCLTQIMKS